MKSRLISRVQMLLIASCIFITTFFNVSLAQNVRVTIDMTDVRMETVMALKRPTTVFGNFILCVCVCVCANAK